MGRQHPWSVYQIIISLQSKMQHDDVSNIFCNSIISPTKENSETCRVKLQIIWMIMLMMFIICNARIYACQWPKGAKTNDEQILIIWCTQHANDVKCNYCLRTVINRDQSVHTWMIIHKEIKLNIMFTTWFSLNWNSRVQSTVRSKQQSDDGCWSDSSRKSYIQK